MNSLHQAAIPSTTQGIKEQATSSNCITNILQRPALLGIFPPFHTHVFRYDHRHTAPANFLNGPIGFIKRAILRDLLFKYSYKWKNSPGITLLPPPF